MHGKVYRGSIYDREVTIKTWDFFYQCKPYYVDHPSRFCNELEMLTGEKPHPSLIKIRGFCFKHVLALVYDEKPTSKFLSDELHSAAEHFGWNGRLRVATQLASLFHWLHEREFLFGCVDSSTIMIDEDFNIKVFDFGFLTHISEEIIDGIEAYYPLCWDDAPEIASGIRDFKSDVYNFGLLLVELIFQRGNVSRTRNRKELIGGRIRSILVKSLLQVDDEQASCITEY
ncbi:probable serine/threonine-protein kinase PBL4 [Lycium barbarum]|uniref:probable serine/threonine-protein kinase PBL4 n=1 Tax=Lycium barbarum TaxID=112863 RepID=UPI00293F5414|nr:probable serine/threonine-protein kinase PBL4 [Lycium barbarum]